MSDLFFPGRVYALEASADNSRLIIHVRNTVQINNLISKTHRTLLHQSKPREKEIDDHEDISDQSLNLKWTSQSGKNLYSETFNSGSQDQQSSPNNSLTLNSVPLDFEKRRKALHLRVSDWKLVEEKLDALQNTARIPIERRLFINYPPSPSGT